MNLSPYILGLVRKYGDYTGFYNIQLASSRDLVSWQRLGDREGGEDPMEHLKRAMPHG